MVDSVKRSAAPRLKFLLASDAPVGVVLRRGPTKLVRLVMWDRRDDTLQPGQWFKGKIYADYSDISPDGRHMIYLAMAGLAWAVPETGGSWTAISILPSLTAVALWGQGGDTRGGGMFISNDCFWLYDSANTYLIRDNSGLHRETYPPDRWRTLSCERRMERDGWVAQGGWAALRPILEKTIHEGWVLRRLGWDGEYELEHPREGKLSLPSWECAEWDRHRLVWADKGCLRAARVGRHGLDSVRTLYDFNDVT